MPQVSGSSPELTAMATIPPKAMYAPARKPATTALSGDSLAFFTPVWMPAAVTSGGLLNPMAAGYPGRTAPIGAPGSPRMARPRAIRATASSSRADGGPAVIHP